MNRYPQAYMDYLVHFHAERDYFECHEVMEEFWKEHPDDPRSRTYVGLIQIAVGVYHQRRGNRAGAVKMLTSSLTNLEAQHVEGLGLDFGGLIDMFRDRIAGLKADQSNKYEDPNLPIKDQALLEHCIRLAELQGLHWGKPSDCENRGLIHKHTLRDRSEVILERERQAQIRRKQRGESL
jgi:uncharacterized protein